MTLYEQLSHLVDLRISGFEESVPPGAFLQASFTDRSAQGWFDELTDRCRSAIGKTYLPVFRLSDGEFYFSVGYRIPRPEPGSHAVLHYLRHAVSYVKYGKHRRFWSGTPDYGYETYAGREWTALREKYIVCLREIAAEGLLAAAIVRTPNHYSERYHRPICGWFERHQIPLTPANYYPFHFVYALLNGPRRSHILQGRRVLVVTSLTPEKQRAIACGLEAAGAGSAQFLTISRSKAMADRISLSGLVRPIDVALVGGGVGAANVLVQLRPLGTLCIDAGYCLDLLADPALAGRREFTRPDQELRPAA
jgi:microcompartment protein CcmK/EutM